MRKGLVIVASVGLGIAALAESVPAAAELVPGGWGDPIPIPKAPPPLPPREIAIVPPSRPARPRVRHRSRPIRRALPNGKVRF